MKDKRNCFNCKYCERIPRTGNYTCLFKKCNMGKIPYYPKLIPENQIMAFGIKICDYTPK